MKTYNEQMAISKLGQTSEAYPQSLPIRTNPDGAAQTSRGLSA